MPPTQCNPLEWSLSDTKTVYTYTSGLTALVKTTSVVGNLHNIRYYAWNVTLTDKDLEHVPELKPVLKEARARKEAKKTKKKATDMKRSMENASQSLEPPGPPQPPPRVEVRHARMHARARTFVHTDTRNTTLHTIHMLVPLQRLRPPSSVMTWEQLEKQYERMNFLV